MFNENKTDLNKSAWTKSFGKFWSNNIKKREG